MSFCKQGLLVCVCPYAVLFLFGDQAAQTHQGPTAPDRPRFVFITNSNSPFLGRGPQGLDDAAKEFARRGGTDSQR